MELTGFLIDCENYPFSVFVASVRLSETFIRYPVAFIANFGLRNVVLRVEICVAIIEFYQTKFLKWIFFIIPVGEKWFPSLWRIS